MISPCAIQLECENLTWLTLSLPVFQRVFVHPLPAFGQIFVVQNPSNLQMPQFLVASYHQLGCGKAHIFHLLHPSDSPFHRSFFDPYCRHQGVPRHKNCVVTTMHNGNFKLKMCLFI